MPATDPPPGDVVRPHPPMFTARTDATTGVIRTRGHLDRVGAELLCAILSALAEAAHRRLAVRLGPATTLDVAARALLADHARRLRADGVRLLVR